MIGNQFTNGEEYTRFLDGLKERIRAAQIRAALAVNREMLLLYRQIGRDLLDRQQTRGWGTRIIDRLAADLLRAFPELKGFSRRNLHYMRAFSAAYPDEQFVQQVAAQLPWGHHMRLLDSVKDNPTREWYMHQTIQHGWSRDILAHQISSGLHLKQGQAHTNFSRALPAPQSELAQQILKDPYNFDFLSLGEEAHERDLERGLLLHIREFLLELGVGFALLGSQYRIEVAGRDYYMDLLFYHARLHCYVVIDLKMVEFEPAFAGTMNFYLSAVDDLLRTPTEQPSIGIILCKGKNSVVAEYALRDMTKPIGISRFDLANALPESFQGSLPTIEDLEAELRAVPESDEGQG